jgi:hypothetical protein
MNAEYIDESGLEIKQTDPGTTPNPVRVASDIHYDIIDLYMFSLKPLADLYIKSIGNENTETVMMCSKDELCEYVKEAYHKGLLDCSKATKNIKPILDELCVD